MRLGILTGGGDVPGLNPCIKALVCRAREEGWEVLGIRRGWAGLLQYNPGDPATHEACVMALDRQNTRAIDRTGGTILHTSRTNPGKVRANEVPAFLQAPAPPERSAAEAKETFDFTPHILEALDHLEVDVLLPIGGEDTLGYALRLAREGFPIVAVPKTMDNDVYGTDYCIGFSTAVSRSVEMIHQLRTSAGSHERLLVVELFGRHSGETSLIAAYLAGVDRAVISEVPFHIERLAKFLVEDQRANPSRYAVVTVSEGARMLGGDVVEAGEPDAYGHRKLGGIGVSVGEGLKRLTGEEVLYQPLSYLMRSGAPDSLDLMVAVNFAQLAMTLCLNKEYGRMVVLRQGVYTHVPIQTLAEGIKRVDVANLYDVDAYRPKVRLVMGKPMFLY